MADETNLPAAETIGADVAPQPPQPETAAAVPPHRQCPTCFGGHGGVGVAYCTRGNKRYYKCKCGMTWVVTVRQVAAPVKVEHREVELRTREECFDNEP